MFPKAIFFDLFNTLVALDDSGLPEVELDGRRIRSTIPAVFEQFRRSRPATRIDLGRFVRDFLSASEELEALKSEGREYPSRVRFQMLLDRLGTPDEGLAERLVDAHMEQMFSSMSLPDRHRQLLRDLEGHRLYLASNFDHAPTVFRLLRETGLGTVFGAVFVSDDVGWRKPSPRFFQHLLERTGVPATDCLFVGDDPVADCGATLVGFQVAWLNPKERRTMPVPPPRWTLSELDGIRQILDPSPESRKLHEKA